MPTATPPRIRIQPLPSPAKSADGRGRPEKIRERKRLRRGEASIAEEVGKRLLACLAVHPDHAADEMGEGGGSNIERDAVSAVDIAIIDLGDVVQA